MSRDLLSAKQGGPAGESCHLAPAYFADLLDRAASLLKVHGVGQPVPFTWWADGEEAPYLAKLEWAGGMVAPRVMVFHGRSGDFVCQSLEGRCSELDTETWCLDVPADEVDRAMWQQGQRRAGKS